MKSIAASRYLLPCQIETLPFRHVNLIDCNPSFVYYSSPLLFMQNFTFSVTKDSSRTLKAKNILKFWCSVQTPQTASHPKTIAQIPTTTLLFHSHYLLAVSWKTPCTLSPQGLCTCWFLCLEYSQILVRFTCLLLSNLYSYVTLSIRHFLSSLGNNNSLYFQLAP